MHINLAKALSLFFRTLKVSISMAIVIIAVAAFPTHSTADGSVRSKTKGYTSIRIYYVRWDLDTRIALTPEDVRRMRRVYMEVKDTFIISNICDLVFTLDYSPATGQYPEPANLVIDFMNHEAIEKTVFANSALIVQDGARLQKRMDHAFIEKLLSSLSLGLESVEEEIQVKNYSDMFNSPDQSFDFTSNGIDQTTIDAGVVRRCKNDFSRFRSGEISLFNVLKYKENIYFYMFNVEGEDDAVISYAYDSNTGNLIYKFFIPMS